MLLKSQALILKKIPYTDHASVVTMYTREIGLQRFLVQGLHKKDNKNAYYQLGNTVEIIFNVKINPGLLRIKEISSLGQNVAYDAFAIQQIKWFYLEIIGLCIQEDHSDPTLFDYIFNHFQQLEPSKNLVYLPIAFLIGLGMQLGYEIDWHSGLSKSIDLTTGQPSTPSTPNHFKTDVWMNQAIHSITQGNVPQLNKTERRMIVDKLTYHLQHHLFPQKQLKSLEIFDLLNAD
jgi:DNA repair protein RecO (recombination protein O)